MYPAVRPVRGGAAVLAATLVLALTGCGSDSETTTVTETTEPATTTSQPTTTEPTTSETTGGGESGGVGPDESTTTETQPSSGGSSGGSGPGAGSGGGTTGPDPSKPDSATNDLPPQPGSPQAKFEKYCDQHPGACG